MRDLVRSQVEKMEWQEVVEIGGNGDEDSSAERQFHAWYESNLPNFTYTQALAVWTELVGKAFNDLSSETS